MLKNYWSPELHAHLQQLNRQFRSAKEAVRISLTQEIVHPTEYYEAQAAQLYDQYQSEMVAAYALVPKT